MSAVAPDEYAKLHPGLYQQVEELNMATLLEMSFSDYFQCSQEMRIILLNYQKEVEYCVFMLNIASSRLIQLPLSMLVVVLKGAYNMAAILQAQPHLDAEYFLNQPPALLTELLNKPDELILLLDVGVSLKELIERHTESLGAILDYVKSVSRYAEKIGVSAKTCLLSRKEELEREGLKDLIPFPKPLKIAGQQLFCQSLILFFKCNDVVGGSSFQLRHE